MSISFVQKVLLFGSLFYAGAMQAWFFNPFPTPKPFTILLEATGDSQTPGRTLYNSFESNVCYTLAHALQTHIHTLGIPAHVILNRSLGQVIAPWHNATMANRLEADLFLSIHAYAHAQDKPLITVYQFTYNHTDILADTPLTFCPADMAYKYSCAQTSAWAKIFSENLSARVLTQGVYQLPFKPLLGIKVPAIAIELGVPAQFDYTTLIGPLTESLLPIITRKK